MEVNVDIQVVEKQVALLKTSVARVNSLYKELNNSLQGMQSWNDGKSQDAKRIVVSCGNDLKKMSISINDAITKLDKILLPLRQYESVNLYGGGSANDNSIIGLVFNSIVNGFSADVKEWNKQLNQISDRLQKIYSEMYEGIISEEKLNKPLSDTVVYETRGMFHSRGMEDGVLGYNDGFRSHIAVGTDHELQTTVHENLHQLSANGNRHGIIIHSNNSRNNVQMNEAITELLTRRTLGEQYGPDYSAYSDNRDAMAVLESVMGEETISRAYFQNRPELMQDMFDGVLGVGAWEQLSEAFDDCLDRYPLTRNSGRVRRDDLINRFVIAYDGSGGGEINWNELI